MICFEISKIVRNKRKYVLHKKQKHATKLHACHFYIFYQNKSNLLSSNLESKRACNCARECTELLLCIPIYVRFVYVKKKDITLYKSFSFIFMDIKISCGIYNKNKNNNSPHQCWWLPGYNSFCWNVKHELKNSFVSGLTTH